MLKMRLLLPMLNLLMTLALLEGALGQAPGGGSCWAARLCCEGRNISCHVMSSEVPSDKEEHVDGKETVKELVKRSMCFCDSACLILNDCCHDYKLACQPRDCIVADDWSEWSECDTRCGPGVKNRTRRVLQKALNGGKPCPTTVQRVACEGTACKVARAGEGHDELRETGRIISAKFGSYRNDVKYSPFKDIRRNIFEQYHRKDLKIDRPPYCMKFELTEVWPACEGAGPDNSTTPLYKGSVVCVECQPEAMRKNLGGRCKGHGVVMKETRWKAVLSSGCHGKWVLKSRQEDCTCQSEEPGNFILL